MEKMWQSTALNCTKEIAREEKKLKEIASKNNLLAPSLFRGHFNGCFGRKWATGPHL